MSSAGIQKLFCGIYSTFKCSFDEFVGEKVFSPSYSSTILAPPLRIQELLDLQAGFSKGRGTRDQIANIHWILEKAREFQKNIYFCFIDEAKAFDCVDHNKLWKILKEMGIPDHLTCLLKNLYVGQEATVRTRLGKEYVKAVFC